jgi:hypothetical protein
MAFSILKARTALVVAGALGATSAFGYWGYAELREHQLREEISELVRDASARMSAALATQVPQTAVDNPGLLRKLYDDAETVDAHFRKVHGGDVELLPELSTAADCCPNCPPLRTITCSRAARSCCGGPRASAIASV